MARLRNADPSSDRPKNYFGLIKSVLRISGISIDGNDSAADRIYSILVILLINISYVTLDFLEIFKHDFTVVAEDISMYLLSFFIASAKAIGVFRNRNKIAKLLNKLEQEPFTPNLNRGGEEEEKLINECLWFTNAQMYTYWSGALAVLISGGFISLTKRLRSSDYHDWVFPYGPLTVLNITYSPNYEITWMYQIICSSYFSAQFTCVDLITAAVLAHTSYQFKMLQINIKRLLRISYKEMVKDTGTLNLLPRENIRDEIDGSVVPWKYLKKPLIEAIEYHSAIISIADEMESLFSSLLLTVFLSSLGLICFLVNHLSKYSLEDPKIWNPAVQVICACFQVGTICYWGEQVVFQSQEVGRAAYEANFVGADLRFQKSLALIIRRSQNPAKLTAGKFSVVSLPTFAWIIRTSYSAFMMLRRTQE